MGLLRPTFLKTVVGLLAVLVTPTTATADNASAPITNASPVLHAAHFVFPDFGTDSGWRGDQHPRFVVDITGDHRADIVAFGNAGVYTVTATGDGGFTNWRFAIADFGFDQGWRLTANPRFVTDITGDGRADIVGIGFAGVYTAVSTGDGAFGPIRFQPGSFDSSTCPGSTWATDINGDRRDDLVCPASGQVQVAIALGNGDFAPPIVAATGFGPSATTTHVLNFADLNRDGRSDLLDFQFVSGTGISTRTASPRSNNTFPPTTPAGAVTSSGQSAIPYAIVDVDGDGCRDLTLFFDVLYQAMNNCDGTFQRYVQASADFGFSTGWNATDHIRAFADITGDGRTDVVGFKNDGVYTANARADGVFTTTHQVATDLGLNAGWQVVDNPRVLADITGDGRADIVGFGAAGVYTAISTGDGGFA
jgi:VCBS repeat protein